MAKGARRAPDFYEQAQWDEEQDATLRAAIARGDSAADAGRELGRSRSSCLGRAGRLGLKFGGHSAPGEARAPRPYRPRSRAVDTVKIAIVKARKVEAPPPPANDDGARPFFDVMGERVCKWFLKGHDGLQGLVCAGPVRADGPCYCDRHRLRNYDRSRAKRQEAA